MRPAVAQDTAPRRRRLRPGTGCALAAVVLLTGFLLGGHVVFRKGIRLVVARAAERLETVPAPALGAARREALHRALDRWIRRRRRGPEAEAAEGRFLALAQAILADGRMDPEEADRLERFLSAEAASP